VTYAIAQAKSGDAEFGALILSGDYDNEFNIYDYNADGVLTVDEMKLPEFSSILNEDKVHETPEDSVSDDTE